MNDQASPRGRLDEDGSGSPKRKKVRSKYTPRACVACRRSKLKCSGENPCLRCLDNGRRCFYSEDQTAAEALQNLSRPTPARPPPPPSVTSNGNGAPRRSILPRNDVMERRGSDASVLGLSMEARMARIEGMMESLIQDRYAGMNPRSSSEIEDVTMDEYNGEAMAQANMDAFAASLVPVRAPPPAIPRHVAHLPQHQSVPANNAFDRVEDAPTVRHGGRDLHFPDPEDYQRYISAFFRDLNKYYPCVNETLFRSQSDAMLASTTINDDYTCHLALTYIIFACMDVLGDAARSGLRGRPAGWQWFQLADGLVDKRKFSGRGDLGLVQCLVFQALYLMFFDQPEAAYTTIGLACRLCYQFGLHKQIKGADYVLFDSQPRHRIFCVVYIVDSRISLSCARPSSMQSIDIDSPLFKEMDKLVS
ncbi:hypothetical protein K491DRAFT_608984 [Lophiostoma macrostomum CBS 122681]|uniref:Zn(2)-C6 fungal-type domain-containing protein n=1 Tax=Lophiostoma macrostomum CBS 122681 TaxID=1314788 RepID=A0A6A6SV97_9PLEO|nr:hypothetical protein K491DRAFT_608984 [Lophiostoma macrostomum CBS 122681]